FHPSTTNPAVVFTISRSYMYFDTSSIDASTANFISGNISIYGKRDFSAGIINIILQNNKTGVHPEVPLVVTDFNYTYYNDSNLGFMPTAGFVVEGWNYIQLNETGLENISLDGYTKYCIRCSPDVINLSFGARFIDYYNCRSLYPPILTLVWNGPEITNEYPRDEQTGIPRYFENFTVTVNDSTSLKMDIYWYIWLFGGWQHYASNNTVNNGTYRQGGIGGFLTCWNYTYQWKVEVVNARGVWANETYSYRSINSTAPVISNIYPLNRTVFGVDPVEISFTVNDTNAQQINIELWYFYENCSYVYHSEVGLSNRTFSTLFKPIWYQPGTIQWFVRIQDISCGLVDNTVYSEVFWFTNLGTWSDHFCGEYVHENPLNLINETNYTSHISPVRSQDSDNPVLYDDPSFVEFRQYMNNTVSDGISPAQSVIASTTNMGSS
ncbi:unnamed protein product, partial [marine sediment metagenome]